MTLASMVLIILAFGMFVVGGELGSWLAEKLHVSQQFHTAWSWARWPFTTVVVMFAAALMYYFLPDVEQEFRFITPGSVVGSFTWLGATWAFTWYVEHFGKYNVTYGSLGGVIVLMLWLYIGGLILIVGGEINSIIEHASDEGKAPGARRAGEAGPPCVDGQPPPITAGAAKRAETGRRLQWAFWRRWRHT
jgi:membrane protein